MTSNRFALAAFLLVAVLSLICIPQAKADVTYDLCTGTVLGNGKCFAGNLFQFTVPTTPTLNPFNVDPGFGFLITPTNLTENGIALASTDFLAFYQGTFSPGHETGNGGGIALFTSTTNDLFNYLGPQLYTGTEQHPTFFTFNGKLSLYDFDTFQDPDIYQVPNPTSTPEPSTLPLLGLGLAAIAGLGILSKR